MKELNIRTAYSHFLKPGYIYISKQATLVRTVLGSGVTVCLWEKKLRCCGITHYVYPFIDKPSVAVLSCEKMSIPVRVNIMEEAGYQLIDEPSKASLKYGNVAIAVLVKKMERAGYQRRDLIAQVFGGATVEKLTGSGVAEENIRIAREMLARKKIALGSEDVGGAMERIIIFDTGRALTAVQEISRFRNSDRLSR